MRSTRLKLPLLPTSSPPYTPQTGQAAQKVPKTGAQEGGEAARLWKQKHRPLTLSLPPGLPIVPPFNQHLPLPSCLPRGPSILPAHQSRLKILQNVDLSSMASSHPPRVLHHPTIALQRCPRQLLQRTRRVLGLPLPLSHYPPGSPRSHRPRPRGHFPRVLATAPPSPSHLSLPPHQPQAPSRRPLSARPLRDHKLRRQNLHPFESLPCQVTTALIHWF